MRAHLSIAVLSALGAVASAADVKVEVKVEAKKVEVKKAEKKAAPKPATFTDPAQAGDDYKTQGEYVGEMGGKKYGVQVVALGEGQFDAYLLAGGLPGDGWDGKSRTKITVKSQITGGEGVITFPEGEIKVKKVERASPTLGAKPPQGAVVLFDGTEATAVGEWDKGKLDGEFLTTMVPGGLLSKRKFGDCKLHIEFRTPFMPTARGQGRGNSGVYNQGRYECQVLDSFGLTGENNECGGLYTVAKPNVNMCFPPLVWQTYDMEFTAAKWDEAGKRTAPAKLTVRHNGVVIHENVEFAKGITTAAPVKEMPGPGPIHLQNHGNPVVFRNIWIVETGK